VQVEVIVSMLCIFFDDDSGSWHLKSSHADYFQWRNEWVEFRHELWIHDDVTNSFPRSSTISTAAACCRVQLS
jgi:hypothetical protein